VLASTSFIRSQFFPPSIAVVDANRLAIVGGDYDHPQMVKPPYSDDGGNMWKEKQSPSRWIPLRCRNRAQHPRPYRIRGWTYLHGLLDA
jgi:hypothetical protein